jgi:hypothetical protein
VDLSKMSREDLMVLGGGILLFIGLLAFPWYSISFLGLGSVDRNAAESPYAIWGILALIVTIVIVVDLALARFSPSTQIPTTQYGRDFTRVGLCALLLLLLFIKFIAHVGSFGWGFFIDVVLALVVSAGSWWIANGRATPVSTTAG